MALVSGLDASLPGQRKAEVCPVHLSRCARLEIQLEGGLGQPVPLEARVLMSTQRNERAEAILLATVNGCECRDRGGALPLAPLKS